MSNREQPFRIDTYANRLSCLVSVGAGNLMVLAGESKPVRFADWSSAVRASFGEALAPTERELNWVWDSLRTEPEVIQRAGRLPAAGVRWTSNHEKFPALKLGQILLIALKLEDLEVLRRSTSDPMDEEAVVVLEAPLDMRPGKANRLECCDVRATVRIRVPKPLTKEREADIMSVPAEQVDISDGVVNVSVDSLNQAYTVTSRRLEPNRRAHGGRSYDHMVCVWENQRLRLEDVRLSVESDSWTVR